MNIQASAAQIRVSSLDDDTGDPGDSKLQELLKEKENQYLSKVP